MSNVTTKTENGAAPNQPQQSQALAPLGQAGAPMVLGNDAYRVGLEPQTLNDAFALAEMVARTGICDVKTPEDALVRMLAGRSLGLSTMQALRGVYVVKGRPSLDASLMQALCLQSPLCEYFDLVSSDERQATYKTKRKGREERVYTFTIEDAERQNLVDRGKKEDGTSANNYVRMPKQMLRARCKSELARLEYPDLMFGMHSREELEAGHGGDEEDLAKRIEREEREIEVEIVPNPVRAAARDYPKEIADLKAKVTAATTRQALREVRDAISKWDGPDHLKKEVGEAYEAHLKAVVGEKPAAKPAANPAPVPENNLFDNQAGKGESKS